MVIKKIDDKTFVLVFPNTAQGGSFGKGVFPIEAGKTFTYEDTVYKIKSLALDSATPLAYRVIVE